MANTEQLKLLKQHIQEISAEIMQLKKTVSPNMSMHDYRELHQKYVSLTNLKMLAKNELRSLLHQYKVTLSGYAQHKNDRLSEKVIRRKVECEIDCKLNYSKKLDLSVKSHQELHNFLVSNFARFFDGAEFKVKTITQVK